MVDDDVTNLTVAMNNLSENYSLFTAPSGEKLFLLLEKVSPALILLDIEMPEMSGYEVLKKLKSDEKTAQIPVIFLTGNMDSSSEVEALSMGAIDYILKPFSKEMLIKRIDLHIALSRERSIVAMNERLSLMLDTSPLCTQIWDRNLNTIDCNEAGVKLYGFKDKSEYTARFLQECSPEYQPDGERSEVKAVRLVNQAFDEGYCIFEWMHQVPDTGAPIPAEVTLVRAKYRNDHVVIGYTRDLREQMKMMETIEHRDTLLEAVNEAATILLTTKEDDDIKTPVIASLELIGRAMEVDGVHLWRSSKTGDDFSLFRLYEWANEANGRIGDSATFSKVPQWESRLRNNECIGGPVSGLSQEEQKYFSSLGIKSVFLIPLFIDQRLWGVFSLDDCTNERNFSEDEIAILRSVSLMMANVINRQVLVEKRTREYALQTSTLKILLDSIPDMIFTKDEKLRYTHCNRALLDHFNKRRVEVIGKDDIDGLGLPPDVAAEHVEKERKIMRERRAITVEEYLPRADGTMPLYETTVLPLMLGNETAGVVGIASDITERKEKEQKMKHIMERAKLLSSALAEITKSPTISAGDLKAAADFIAKEGCRVLDVSRISIWRVTENEDALINISAYERAEGDFTVEDDFNLLDREDYKALLKSERLIVTSNVRESAQIDAGYNPELCAMLEAPVRIDGVFVGLVAADQDKSDVYFRSRLWTIEEQSFVSSLSDLMALAISGAERKRARNEAQEASQAKSDFLANMSHEIRTPMNVIVGLTELLLEDESVADSGREYLQKINTAGNTLVGLINDVLDISKIESGKFSLLPTPYELASLLNDVIVLSIMRIGDKPITFDLDIDGEMFTMLNGDDLRVKQIIVNLLSNAFKYTRKGSVTLKVRCDRENEKEVRLHFSVIDTGIGMREEDLAKLFSNYNQVDTRANRMIEGTGLGLAIAKGFVELMDGEISVTSEYGVGSTFEFSIKQGFVSEETLDEKTLEALRKFRYEDSKNRVDRQIKRPDLSWATVLVVDDAPTNLDVAKGLLGKYKMKVDCVLNGHDAIDRMRSEEPVYHAIFMDHMMPGMDGIETAKWIRKIGNDYTENIPIIALTANAVAGNERLFLEEGFQAFVSKPISVVKLDTVVRQWIMKDMEEQPEPEVTEESSDAEAEITVDIPGVNASLGLSLYEDDMDMYIGILHSFAENTQVEIDKLKGLSEENIDEYAIDIHTMKGISATIGAKSLSVRAKKMERMAKEGDVASILEVNEEFIKDAETLVVDVQNWLAENSP